MPPYIGKNLDYFKKSPSFEKADCIVASAIISLSNWTSGQENLRRLSEIHANVECKMQTHMVCPNPEGRSHTAVIWQWSQRDKIPYFFHFSKKKIETILRKLIRDPKKLLSFYNCYGAFPPQKTFNRLNDREEGYRNLFCCCFSFIQFTFF